MLTFRQFPSNTVDGSEIRRTTWVGAKTSKIMGFQLPTSTGERSISEPSTVPVIIAHMIHVIGIFTLSFTIKMSHSLINT